MFQLIIKNGKVIDGSGSMMQMADVGVRDGRISEIGNLQNESAELVIDARGKYVAPGFIDVSNHSDVYWQVFNNPEMESLLFQGITTIIGGNCGSSLAPLVSREALYSIQKWTDLKGKNVDWSDMKDFLEKVQKIGMAVNFGTLIGQSTLKRGMLRDHERDLSSSEIKAAEKVIRQSLKEGALGLSTGLAYSHAKKTSADEISHFVKAVAGQKGIYATHLRAEGEDLLEAVREALETAREAKARLHISHFKVTGKDNWRLQKEALEILETAKNRGMEISFDVFPYEATGSVLYTLLPDWVSEGGKKMMISRINDLSMRKEIIEELREKKYDYSKISVSVSPISQNLNRRNILEMARFQGKSPEETLLDVLTASDGKGTAVMDILSAANVEKALLHPLSVVSSNGSGYNLKYRATGNQVHPRNFGSFPRFLKKYVRDKKSLSWEEAIGKMSGKSAEIFNIRERGFIRKGYWADIVVFDPERIADKATFENPYQYSEGIDFVAVNGRAALQNGKSSGTRAGRVVSRK